MDSPGGKGTRSAVKSHSICYVVPYLARDDASHFSHLPGLLSELGRHCEVHVLVEKGESGLQIPNTEVHLQRYGNAPRPIRVAELAVLVYRLYRAGCRKFFVRISTGAAVTIGLVGLVLPIELYYWSSGQSKGVVAGRTAQHYGRLLASVREWLAYVPLRMALRLCHRFVTGPETMGDYYVRTYGVDPRKVIIIYNDIDLTRFSPPADRHRVAEIRKDLGIGEERPVALFLHRLSPLQGGDYLIPILRSVRTALDDFAFVVVGDGPFRDQLDAEIISSGVTHQLLVAGPVPNARTPDYYRAADVFIMPSRGEGFPRVLLEAMGSGLPVVCFEVGGVRDILGPKQQAYVVERGNTASFAHKLVQLLGDPTLRSELSEENLREVQRFSTDRVVQMFLNRIVLT